MTSKQRRPNAGISGAKALIASAAIAATVGGWAAFSNANANTYQSTPTQAVVVAQAASTSYNLTPLQLTPLPTLVPTVNIIVPNATQPVTQSGQTSTSAAQPTATAVPATDTPAPTDTPVPTATTVTVVQRPQTVTTTRSSRKG